MAKYLKSTDTTMLKSKHHADSPTVKAASPHEMERGLMSIVTNNRNTTDGPRVPGVRWGFQPMSTEAHLFLGNTGASKQMSESVLPTASAEVGHTMVPMQSLCSRPVVHTADNLQQSVGIAVANPLYGVESDIAMPYQYCRSPPTDPSPLHDGGKLAADRVSLGVAQLNPFVPNRDPMVYNQLSDSYVPSFGSKGVPQTTLNVDDRFQGLMISNDVTSLFSDVARPSAAAAGPINHRFSMPTLMLLEDEEDERNWNGSCSDSNSVSISDTANTVVTASASLAASMGAGSEPTPPKSLIHNNIEEDKTKPKRARRLCSVSKCGKRARSQDLCIAHGGGRRCIVKDCNKSSQGGNMCIKHGGGKRCTYQGCNKAAQTNSLCKAHGGGSRCQFPQCSKSSQGGGFCRAHGGGKRCVVVGCSKGTQRGDFCALHGGSRFCEVPGCMRNDRGGGFCAQHGGGKRCNIVECNRSCRRNGLCSTHLRLLGHDTGENV
uniref:WRKY19-like zinc finger domain-containing protein n=1 Tax=Hyaloperonospora arabidopsidis (strain Emoy2) TaxID=559515 RepID=M4B4K7_HYAAE